MEQDLPFQLPFLLKAVPIYRLVNPLFSTLGYANAMPGITNGIIPRPAGVAVSLANLASKERE